MNTNIKMAYKCHAMELLFPHSTFIRIMRNLVCIFLLLQMTTNLIYAQTTKKGIGVTERYETELEKRLNPALTNYKIKAQLFFQVTYDPLPERSLRLIDAENNSFLEARILNKNLHESLSIYSRNYKSKTDIIKVTYHRVNVSKQFRNNMLYCSNKVLCIKDPVRKPQLYDGMYFKYRTNTNGSWRTKTIAWELDKKSFEYQVSTTNMQIIEDIRTGTFDETKYLMYNQS